MIKKNKLTKQVSLSLLAVLLSGSLNTLAVFANTTEDPNAASQSSSEIQAEKIEQSLPNQKVIPSDSSVSVPEVSQTSESESKATTTSQKDENTKTETTTQVKSASSTPLLRGANPADGTPGLQYNADYTEVTGYTGTATDVVIPSGVTSIGDAAFLVKHLTTVTIPDSVTSIGSQAFYSNQLTTVTIPDSVTNIGSQAFYLNQLRAVIIPDSVTSIGDAAFQSNQLTTVTIPNSVTSIGNSTFQSNQLTSVNIPDSVTSIGSFAFYDNQLTTVTIPNSVTSIGDGVFQSNHLALVTIPDSVTSIGNGSFALNQLTTVTIPDSVTSIGSAAFAYNQLNTVTIPDSVTSIGWGAFAYNQLTTVTIPDSVTTVGDEIAINQAATTTKVRRASYTSADLGISTHHLEDKPVTLTSQTPGVTFDGTSLHLDPSFTGNQFVVEWTSWDGKHTGSLTVNLVESVKGTITYLDEAGKALLPAKDVSSQVGGTFTLSTPEAIPGHTVDLDKSQVITTVNGNAQGVSLKEAMSITHTDSLDALIAILNQQNIAKGTESVELRYVYNDEAVKGTISYVDNSGNTLLPAKDVSSQVGGTFNWTTPENIADYALDLSQSQVITTSDSGQQVASLNDMLSLTHTTTLEGLIAYLNQQPIAAFSKSVELRYVYTENPVSTGQVTVKYVDTDGHSIGIPDKVLTGAIGTPYQTEQLTINGYTFKSVEGNMTGQYKIDPQVVTYVYAKNSNQPVTPTPDNQSPQASSDKQLPSTGDNQKTSLISSILGAIALIIVLTFVGLRIKQNRSSK